MQRRCDRDAPAPAAMVRFFLFFFLLFFMSDGNTPVNHPPPSRHTAATPRVAPARHDTCSSDATAACQWQPDAARRNWFTMISSPPAYITVSSFSTTATMKIQQAPLLHSTSTNAL